MLPSDLRREPTTILHWELSLLSIQFEELESSDVFLTIHLSKV